MAPAGEFVVCIIALKLDLISVLVAGFVQDVCRAVLFSHPVRCVAGVEPSMRQSMCLMIMWLVGPLLMAWKFSSLCPCSTI